jgi:ppGpp synthetase/RelA/SpoT-type nucleotidyltranferase
MKTLKLTQQETKKLQSQYSKGSTLSKQNAIVKIYNPYGRGTWFLINQDPSDPDYIWAIIDMGNGVDVGSVSLSQLQSIRVKVFGAMLPLEKDSGFRETNALEIVDGLSEGRYFKDGGEVKVKILTDKLNQNTYKAIYGDLDGDGVPDIDDKAPKNPKITETVEQVKLQEVFDIILKTKKEMQKKMQKTVKELTKIAPKDSTIYARTKTPYSILNKLVNKKMYNMKPTQDGDVEGLTDLVGTSIVVNNIKEIKEVQNKLDNGELGKVMERKDYYENPKDGYMAVHYIIESQNVPVEVQLKTKRQKALSESSHNPYKYRNLDSERLLNLSKLADKADKGDPTAIRDFDLFLKDPKALENSLYADKVRLNRLPS